MTATAGDLRPRYVTVKEAARYLASSTWAVYQLLDKGAIESRYQGRKRLVVVTSLEGYADSLPSTPPTPASA